MLSLEVLPCPRLRPYVQLIWCFELDSAGELPSAERIAPDGVVELVFHYRDPMTIRFAGDEPATQQFHQEGFVNQYVHVPEESTALRLVFVSEAFENLDGRWRAREIYEVSGDDAFTETFELAEPGKGFQVYSKTSFRRRARH